MHYFKIRIFKYLNFLIIRNQLASYLFHIEFYLSYWCMGRRKRSNADRQTDFVSTAQTTPFLLP